MGRFQHTTVKQRQHRFWLSLFLSVAVLVIFYTGIDAFSADSIQRQKSNLEHALQRSITYCYATEGAYPQDLDYLKSHYGLTWDENLFYVDYRVSAANIYPDVTILNRKGEVH